MQYNTLHIRYSWAWIICSTSFKTCIFLYSRSFLIVFLPCLHSSLYLPPALKAAEGRSKGSWRLRQACSNFSTRKHESWSMLSMYCNLYTVRSDPDLGMDNLSFIRSWLWHLILRKKQKNLPPGTVVLRSACWWHVAAQWQQISLVIFSPNCRRGGTADRHDLQLSHALTLLPFCILVLPHTCPYHFPASPGGQPVKKFILSIYASENP